jgi:alpha-glucosidase
VKATLPSLFDEELELSLRNSLHSWRHRLTLITSILCCLHCFGSDFIGNVSGVKSLRNGIEVRAGKFAVRITALSQSTIRVRYSRTGSFPPKESFAVDPSSSFTPPEVKLEDKPDFILLHTTDFNIRIEKAPFRLVFEEPTGTVISQDYVGRPVEWNGAAFRVWKSMPTSEHYFGLGDKAGPLDHRDQAFTMWNSDHSGFDRGTDPLYNSFPFFLGVSDGSSYGIFLDNTYRSSFDFGKESRDAYSFGAEDGELDYYFFHGPDPKAVIGEYTQLTGHTPLPPLFMLGYQQCRWTYTPESRVRELANEFRTRQIPADVIWLDIGFQKGNAPFTIDRDTFPHFEGMVKDLSSEGFKTIAITDLHIKKEVGYKPYDEGMAGDHFVKNPDGSVYVGKVWPGDSVFPDFTQSDARQWWGTLYKEFVGMGVRGFWNDMNEPSVFDVPDKTMPLNIVHRVDGRATDHREVHNVYGMQNARATYEGLLALSPHIRPVVMTRASFSGGQRYAATWTGDNSSTWSHLQLSLPMLLNLGVSGYALAGDDIGGFGGSPKPDLLTRWFELGTFTTIDRNHTAFGTADQEPWVHGPEQENIRRHYIEARYRLLPYIYTSMEETARTGLPLMRPMFLEFPADPDFVTTGDEYMFGPSLLVSPQISEMIDPQHVALPRGEWFDYWTGRKVPSQSSLTIQPKLDKLPVFVRAGAIIPQQPVVQHVEEIPNGPLELRVYPGPGCQGSLYQDDGNTLDYLQGKYYRATFLCQLKSDSIAIAISKPEGTYLAWWKSIRVETFGITAKPKDVTLNGSRRDDWTFDPETQSVAIEIPYDGHAASIRIEKSAE